MKRNLLIKLAIVDDHEMFREGLKSIISGLKNIEVTLECSNGQEFLDQFSKTEIDVVLMDMDMPVLNGIDTMGQLKQINSDVKVIIVSSHKSENYIANVMELGARGYVLKEANSEELQNAIQSVYETGYFFNDLVSQTLLIKLISKDHIKPTFNHGEQLSEREQEVLQLICKEHTAPEIGKKLFISTRTVEGHRNNILSKTGSKNIAGLVVYAIKNNLVHV